MKTQETNRRYLIVPLLCLLLPLLAQPSFSPTVSARLASVSSPIARPSLFAAQDSPIVFSGAGTSDTIAMLNAFRTAIGGVDNGNVAAPQNGGRREINWDGVKLDGTDFGGNTTVIVPNKIVGIQIKRFQTRGVVLAEVYAVSGDGFFSGSSGEAGMCVAFTHEVYLCMVLG